MGQDENACYGRGSFFRVECFVNDGAPSQKNVGNRYIFLFTILFVHPVHGSFNPVAVLFFSNLLFLDSSKATGLRILRENWCTSIVARV